MGSGYLRRFTLEMTLEAASIYWVVRKICADFEGKLNF